MTDGSLTGLGSRYDAERVTVSLPLSRAHAPAELEGVLGGPPPSDVLDTVRRDLGLASS